MAPVVVLRLSRPSALMTATVFEELFAEQLGSVVSMRHADTAAWCRAVFGPPGATSSLEAASGRLAAALGNADFLAPNYEAAVFAPAFLAMRNRARLRTRLLLVAHAPGAWPLECASLGRLMAPGDVIVAPSESAAALIGWFDSALAPFVTIIPHPMAPLAPAAVDLQHRTRRVVSLGRIHPSKLLHRHIEALNVLRERGCQIPALEVAGAAETPAASTYLRALEAMVGRLGLLAHVRFVGGVNGRAAKAQFLAGASALVNLSVAIEESFGKAPIEALGCGVPVLGTRWDGLPETIGACGVLLPVACGRGVAADVSPSSVADGLQQLLDNPPSPEACRQWAGRFAPPTVVPRYRQMLEAAVAVVDAGASPAPEPPGNGERAAPATGLLAAAAPITTMTWERMFSAYRECCDDVRRAWEGSTDVSAGSHLRAILLRGTREPIESFLAGQPQPIPPSPAAPVDGEFLEQVAEATVQPAAPSTRVACLVHLWQAGRLEDLRRGLERLQDHETPTVRALRAEAARLAGNLAAAFQSASDGLDLRRDDGTTAFRLRQLARIARAADAPERAEPWLAEWLQRFPDSPDSGAVWLDLCINAAAAGGPERLPQARRALDRARALLGDVPALDAVERMVVAAHAVAVMDE